MRMLRVSKGCDSDPRKRVKNIFFRLTNSTRVQTTRLKSKKNYHKLLLGQIQSTCANHRKADKTRELHRVVARWSLKVSSALDSSPDARVDESRRSQSTRCLGSLSTLAIVTRVGSIRFSLESENNLNIDTRRKWKFNLSFSWKQKVVLFNLYQLKLFSVEFKP